MNYNLDDALKTLEHMKQRASCRSFLDKPIPKDLLKNIIETGLTAASGGNLQPISIIVIEDKEDRKKLREINSNQKFIEDAPVNLLFVLDFHKMGIYAKSEKAPYTCHKSYMHYLIGIEDVVCMAQVIETAAHLCGLGSCYVGTVNFTGDEHIKHFNLPEKTFPVLMLSLGYPKGELAIRKKLDYDIMVFDGKYPDLKDEEIIAAYTEKYKDARMPLPPNEEFKKERLDKFKEALLTSYSKEEADDIIKKASELGFITETQRRFGLHYHANDMLDLSKSIMQMMKDNDLNSFQK